MRLLSILISVCALALLAAPPTLARPDASARRVDVNGTVVAGGDPVTVTIPANENALITFSGTANQRVSLALSGVSIWMSDVSIRKPDGSDLVSPTVVFSSGKFIETRTLPTTGTYTIFVDPFGSASGSMTLQLFDVPADAGGSIIPGGGAVTVTTGTPGQDARLTFSGSQGQRVSVKATGSNMTAQGAYVSILKPDGSTLASSYPNLVTNSAMRFLDTATLPSTGTYTVLLDFYEHATGSGTVTLYDVPADITGSTTPTAAGTSTTVNPATPGQDARYTFSGTAGQRVSLMSTGSGLAPAGKGAFVSILKPDGSTLVTSYPFLLMDTAPRFLDATVLPSNGTYTVRIDPWEETTGSATFQVYDVPPDLDDVLAIGGDAFTVNPTVPGQDGRLPFAGVQGQQVTLYRQDATIPTSIVQILKPDGSVLSSSGAVGTPDGSQTTTLPESGTYTVRVDGFNEATGSMTLSLEHASTAPSTIAEDNSDYVTFRNEDGLWTIYKRCIPALNVGPGYIAKYVTFEHQPNQPAVNGLGQGGGNQFTSPTEGGLGIFGFLLRRGTIYKNVSVRGCASAFEGYGVKSAIVIGYGENGTTGTAYYNQDVVLGDAWTPDMVTVKYRWVFEQRGVKLLASVVENCENGACGSGAPSAAYIKAPQFVANINGPISTTSSPNHASTFDRVRWLGQCVDLSWPARNNCEHADFDCNWEPPPNSSPHGHTGKCYQNERTRVRIDFEHDNPRGGCTPPAGRCFNIVARARQVLSGQEPGGAASFWENTDQRGLDYWARLADERPAADAVDGCTLETDWVTNLAHGYSRNWEYGGNTNAAGQLSAVSIGFKAWDSCTRLEDAGAFFRRMHTGAYAVFMSFSLNAGWKLG